MFSLRLCLTEECNAQCPHCFNSPYREKEYMDTSKLFEFYEANKKPLQNMAIKVMGGEPTLHPEFDLVVSKS